MVWYLSGYDLLSRWALQSSVVLAVTAVAVAFLRQPAKRLLLIEWSFLACLILPFLGLLDIPREWSWRWPSMRTSAAGGQASGTRQRAGSMLATHAERASSPPELIQTRPADAVSTHPGNVPPRDTGRAAAELPPHPMRRLSWGDPRFLCVLGYLVGVGLMAAWWLIGFFGLARVLRRSRPADARCHTTLREIAGQPAARVWLRESPLADQPFMFGWLRPTIILPEQLVSGDAAPLRWSLAHEWSHVSRGDAWWWSLAGIVRLALFFHPLVWWLRGQLRLAQDYLADADAAGHAPAREDYAQFLTAWAGARRRRPVYGGLGILGRQSELYRRVAMLVLNQTSLDRRCSRCWSGGIACLLLAVLVIVATYGGVAAEPPLLATAGSNDEEAVAEKSDERDEQPAVKASTVTAPSDKKGRLRYAGRSFDDWREQLLDDLDEKTCVAAMEPIVSFGKKGYRKEAIAALVQTLHDDRDEVVADAANSLARFGAAAVPALIDGLTDRRARVRGSSASALQAIGADAKPAAKLLLKLVDDHDTDVRSAAITALVAVAGDDEALQPTFERIADSDVFFDRQALYRGLSTRRPRSGELLRLLLRLTEDDNASLRASAGHLLADCGPPHKEVIGALKRLVRDLDQQVWWGAFTGLTNARDNTATQVEVLADAIASRDAYANLRQTGATDKAIAILGGARDQADLAVPVLIDFVDGKFKRTGPAEVHSAIQALGRLGPAAKAAIPALKRRISEGGSPAALSSGLYNEFTPKYALRALLKIQGSDQESQADTN